MKNVEAQVHVRRIRGAALLALLLVSAAPAAAQTVVSAPVGVLSGSFARGESGFSVPLIAEDVFVGVAQSNTSGAIAFPESAGDVGSRLVADGRYYLEVMTGPLEGERLDVNVEATMAAAAPTAVIALGPTTFSTLPAVAPDALAGARCVLRPHLTLARLQALFEPGLVGNDRARSADGVRLLEQGHSAFYFLRADGATWRVERSEADQRDKVIPPDASFVVDLRSQAQSWTQAGKVRTNAFRKNLVAGLQSFASGFPVDVSPAQIGAAVSASQPAATRWTGHNLPVFADQFHLLFRPGRPFDLYYLRHDGTTWRSLQNPANVANAPILGATGAILLRRINPNAAFTIPRPFGL